MASLVEPAEDLSSREFTVLQQSLDLEVDFLHQSLKGTTELHITPLSGELRQVGLHCRQCDIKSLTIEGKAVKFDYRDPYKNIKPHATWNVQQHHLFKERFTAQFADPPREELVIQLSKNVVVQEQNPLASAQLVSSLGRGSGTRGPGSLSAAPETPGVSGAELHASYAPIVVRIEFETRNIRQGLHFVGLSSNDSRYPHAFTTNSTSPGTACCLFPCIDDTSIRCQWSINMRCPKTLGDALGIPVRNDRQYDPDGVQLPPSEDHNVPNHYGLSEEERGLEMHVACSGQVTDEMTDPINPAQKIYTFSCEATIAANQIGFAIGPFEKVDLAEFRELDVLDKADDDAVTVSAWCLPGRAQEVRNTAMPLSRAADFFKSTFALNPFRSYQMCFLDDLPADTIVTAGLSLCSTRLLFPEDIIDPMYDVTRTLVHALAAQYAGICVAPRDPTDNWCIVGIAYFMTDVFMKHLCGNNEYRFRQKMASDRVCELDHVRPSLSNLGSILHLDPSEYDFLALKSGVVLFILDRRLAKSTSATAGMVKIIMRIILNARASFDGEGTLLSTAQFQRQCEKIGRCKLEPFFQQWVHGAGCPQLTVVQRFNKKKLVVEMQIKQTQADPEQQQRSQDLNPDYFMRDVNEDSNEVWAADVQNVFTGPMTIRIHEADGTPYEHIVEIKEANTKFEIPYNTKYKRLKRSRRQKERAIANPSLDSATENRDEALLYCLGDVLATEDEIARWRLSDWSKEDENKMGQESYEWIRMDADFEWICKMQIGMPAYMYVSQLQQDRDVVAQHESLQWIAAQRPHPLISTFLARTVMDRRYFHGIRTEAVSILPNCAKDELGWIGFFHLERIFYELFCVPNSAMTRPNDFSDRASYLVQSAIPKAVAKVRNNAGIAPMSVKRFLLDKLKFNDNSNNEYSDTFYVANLITCLADTLTTSSEYASVTLSKEDQSEDDEFRKEAISEIERYRRIDEWLSSYHNMFSVTALQCMVKLARSNVLQPRQTDFLQYTRPGNADILRLTAFRCLGEMGAFRNGSVLKYCFRSTANDLSPYMREQIFHVLGRGLGLIAIGEDKVEVKKQDTGGLIVEEGSTEARQADLARRQTIAGAMSSLQSILGTNQVFRDGLWDALSSPMSSLTDVWRLLSVCELVVDPTSSLIVRLKLPHYWKCSHEGEGKMHFSQTGRVRERPHIPFQRPAPRPAVPARQPTIKLPPVRKPSVSLNLNLGRAKSHNSLASIPVAETPTVVREATPVSKTKSTISLVPKSNNIANKKQPTPSPVPVQTKTESTSPALDRKSMPPPRSLIVKLRATRFRDPAFFERVAQTPSRPPTSSRRSSKASSRPSSSSSAQSRPGTLNLSGLTGLNGHLRPSPSPALKEEPGSPAPLSAISGAMSPPPLSAQQSRRRSSAASASTSASKPAVSKKRKSSATPMPSADANGAPGPKRRKSTPRKSGTSSATPEQATDRSTNGTPDGMNVNGKLHIPATNGKKRKSDVSVAEDDNVNGLNGATLPPAKKRKSGSGSARSSATPAAEKAQQPPPKKKLMVKLKIGKGSAAQAMSDKIGPSGSGTAVATATTVSGPNGDITVGGGDAANADDVGATNADAIANGIEQNESSSATQQH